MASCLTAGACCVGPVVCAAGWKNQWYFFPSFLFSPSSRCLAPLKRSFSAPRIQLILQYEIDTQQYSYFVQNDTRTARVNLSNPPADVTDRPRILTNKSVCHPCMVNANGTTLCGIAGLLSIVGNTLGTFLLLFYQYGGSAFACIPLHISLRRWCGRRSLQRVIWTDEVLRNMVGT